MDLISIIFIGIGLSMDAFAVSVTCGLTLPPPEKWNAFKIAFSFGLFQALMPVIGWFTGKSLSIYIQQFDHYIAFIILFLIGTRMIYKARKEGDCDPVDPTNFTVLLMLSIATSIDALAVGVTFAFLDMTIITPILIIGLITFIISTFGVILGNKLGCRLGKTAEIVGGVVLIIIGIEILIKDLLA
jgi:putative Mn2+ efflux pump MntP